MALWQRSGKFSLLNTDGKIIPLEDISEFRSLIVLIGSEAPKKATKLFQVLAKEPELATKVKAAVWIGARRWNLHLNNSTKIYLPEFGADGAWSRLAKIYQKQQSIFEDLELIDLRLADRIVVQERYNMKDNDRKLRPSVPNARSKETLLKQKIPKLGSSVLKLDNEAKT